MSETLYWVKNTASDELAILIPFFEEWRAQAVAAGLEEESDTGSRYTVDTSL